MIDSVGLGAWSCQRRRKKSREEGGFVVDIFVVGRGRGWSWRVELKFGEATRQTTGLFICMGNGREILKKDYKRLVVKLRSSFHSFSSFAKNI